ncbi:MAG TPA: hypothetical protein VJH23_04975 [archaeon]|nr:hypothetical protein [archaeon]
MTFLSEPQGYLTLLLFGAAMILITWFFTKHRNITNEHFIISDRKMNWWLGAGSIAASWIWAPALFISSQMAYQLGLPGIFWFVFPNVIAVAVFVFLAPRIREKFPQGHTLAEYISERLGDKNVHKIYFLGQSFYQLMAVATQLFVGASLTSLLTGIPIPVAIILLAAIVFIYAWTAGFESSVVTDFVQLIMIFAGLIIVIPPAISAAGGLAAIQNGLGGITGLHTDIFDPAVAFSFGIITSIGLIAGSILDQQFWQRAFAFESKSIKRGFLAGAILFGIVPITLSLLGFAAAAPGSGILLPEGTDPSMIGVLLVAHYLPSAFLIAFFVMLLAGLASTLDSALSAFSSIYTVDIKKYSVSKDLSTPRSGMILILALGLVVAFVSTYIPGFGLKQLFWFYGAIAASLLVPTLLSLYWEKLTAKGAFNGMACALLIGLPIFVYGNLIDNNDIIVAAALFIVAINIAMCWIFRKKQ